MYFSGIIQHLGQVQVHVLLFNILCLHYEINLKLTLTDMVSMVLKPELFYNSGAVKLMEKERNPPQKQAKAEKEKPLLAPHKTKPGFKILSISPF